MNHFLRRTWCEINLDHVAHNIEQIRQRANKRLIAVVKADAYGHGDRYFCVALEKAGIDFFAVSNLAEACALRKAGFMQEILILGYTPAHYAAELCDLRLIQTVYDAAYADMLNQHLVDLGQTLPVHLKIDTGMNRLGFPHHPIQTASAKIADICARPALNPVGIFTHFSHADSFCPDDVAYTNMQQQMFEHLLHQLAQQGITFDCIHTQNSGGIITQNPSVCNAVRAGIVLYGLSPSDSMKQELSLKPAMSLKSVVSMIKTVPPGTAVSYGRTFITKRQTQLATVPVGYADGYPRMLSAAGEMLVGGTRCRIAGRVCMDQTVLDVTHLPDLAMGDVVTVFGTDQQQCVTVDEIAALAGTINYEIVCGISRRVPRVYIQNDTVMHVADYLSNT